MSNPAAQQIVDDFLRESSVPLGPECPCPYLPGRQARHRGFLAGHLDPDIYHALMNRGYRRSGEVFYQPDCHRCSACRQLRIAVRAFRPSRSQRRVWRRNRDLQVRCGAPTLTRPKWELYSRYLAYQHDNTMSNDYENMRHFLYDSPVHTVEVCYERDGQLLGVSIADQSSLSLSSVYVYFDPDHAARSLGTYAALWEIEYCRLRDIPYYYLGFYVKDCSKMNYKAAFNPHELLSDDYRWVCGDR